MSIDERSLGTHPRNIIERSELFRNLPYRQNLAAISPIGLNEQKNVTILQSAERARRRASVPAPSHEEASAGGAAAGRTWRHGTWRRRFRGGRCETAGHVP